MPHPPVPPQADPSPSAPPADVPPQPFLPSGSVPPLPIDTWTLDQDHVVHYTVESSPVSEVEDEVGGVDSDLPEEWLLAPCSWMVVTKGKETVAYTRDQAPGSVFNQVKDVTLRWGSSARSSVPARHGTFVP